LIRKNDSKRKLGLSGVETNESEYGQKLYLPTDDTDWENLLRANLKSFQDKLKLSEKQIMTSENSQKENGIGITKHMLFTSSLFYRIELLQLLVQQREIDKKESEKQIQSGTQDFDEDQYEEAWRQVRILLNIIEYKKPATDKYRPLKVGKAICRSLLAGEDFTYPRDNTFEKFIRDSDFIV